MRQLVIFDIDGTLTDTMGINTDAYAKTFLQCYGIKINTNWSAYQYSTDSGFLIELFDVHFRRIPTTQETTTFKEIFFKHFI